MKLHRIILSAATIAAFVFGSASAAIATPTDQIEPAPTDAGVVEYAPMDVASYDHAVAEANGYIIETGKNGVEHSVAVTAAAQLEEAVTRAEYEAQLAEVRANTDDGGVGTRGYDEVAGNCGFSYIDAGHNGVNYVNVLTGYSVSGNVASRSWGVWLNGFGGSRSFSFSGGATPPVWGGQASLAITGGGIAHVTLGSFAQLTNGAICYSGNPSTAY